MKTKSKRRRLKVRRLDSIGGLAARKIAALKAQGWNEVDRTDNCVELWSPSPGGPPCDMVVVHASGSLSGPKRDVVWAKFLIKQAEQDASASR